MKRTEIILGGIEYSVPHADLGQIEEVFEVFADQSKSGFKQSVAVATVLLRDAEPRIEDARKLRCAPQELRHATLTLLAASGLGEAKPGEAAAATD